MPTDQKYVYFIGIAGRATSSIAHMFLELGYEVEGSDQNCFPPASTMLDDLGVSYHTPYDADKITRKPDLVVTVGTYGKTTPSALLSLVFQEAGLDPSFMIGGVPGNFTWGTRPASGN